MWVSEEADRELTAKYGCELAEVREQRRTYLKDNGLFPKDTLNDSVHLNKLGNFLIGRLMMPYLRHDAKFPKDLWQDLVRNVAVGDPAVKRGDDGSLELTFEGNRVDVIARHTSGQKLGTAKVLEE